MTTLFGFVYAADVDIGCMGLWPIMTCLTRWIYFVQDLKYCHAEGHLWSALVLTIRHINSYVARAKVLKNRDMRGYRASMTISQVGRPPSRGREFHPGVEHFLKYAVFWHLIPHNVFYVAPRDIRLSWHESPQHVDNVRVFVCYKRTRRSRVMCEKVGGTVSYSTS